MSVAVRERGLGGIAEDEGNGDSGSGGGKHAAPRNACGKGHQEPFEGEVAGRLVGAQEAP
ncbi:hypothetical protein Adi01nite_28840 [Amorphoplanes digitatis]|nr:hypothetical protein GCM10020092_089340 [Actinoplanes digitatis]GID93472.1 hypothetical protein Adi01nite_28840 [Actinoplanes digitatis]